MFQRIYSLLTPLSPPLSASDFTVSVNMFSRLREVASSKTVPAASFESVQQRPVPIVAMCSSLSSEMIQISTEGYVLWPAMLFSETNKIHAMLSTLKTFFFFILL